MTPNELSAKIADIEKWLEIAAIANAHCQWAAKRPELGADELYRRQESLDAADRGLGGLVRLLPPGILAAMCEVALASLAMDDGLVSIVNMPNDPTELDKEAFMQQQLLLTEARRDTTATFRALLTKEPA